MLLLFNKEEIHSLFDTQRIIDAKTDIVQYCIGTQDGLMHFVYIEPMINFVGLSVSAPNGTLVNIALHHIVKIECEKKEAVVKLCFYQESKNKPIATFMVKPNIAILFHDQQ